METCKFGEQKFIDRGYYFICKLTGSHCGKFHVWCNLNDEYRAIKDCNTCSLYQQEVENQAEKAKLKTKKDKKEV